MALAANFSSDLDVYKTSTDAVVSEFKSGKLYTTNPEQYYATILSICNHFKYGLQNVERGLNDAIIIAGQNFTAENADSGMDFVYAVFEILGEYVDLICDDFKEFKTDVTAIVPKDDLPYRANIEFNNVEQLVMDLHKKVERIRTQLLSQFVMKLSDAQLKNRAVN